MKIKRYFLFLFLVAFTPVKAMEGDIQDYSRHLCTKLNKDEESNKLIFRQDKISGPQTKEGIIQLFSVQTALKTDDLSHTSLFYGSSPIGKQARQTHCAIDFSSICSSTAQSKTILVTNVTIPATSSSVPEMVTTVLKRLVEEYGPNVYYLPSYSADTTNEVFTNAVQSVGISPLPEPTFTLNWLTFQNKDFSLEQFAKEILHDKVTAKVLEKKKLERLDDVNPIDYIDTYKQILNQNGQNLMSVEVHLDFKK